MIPVSMSRKTRSFGQLITYMDSEKSDKLYDLHHNCFARGQETITRVFQENSQHLAQRKNGNILYHEIISITLEDGVELKYAKDCLRDIAEKYIDRRCPHNVVYGSLHEDHKNHLHYHLMISANPLGEQKRLSLTKAEFETVKYDLEAHVLKTYPELKQKAINTRPKRERSESRKASAQKRRTGTLDRKEQVKVRVIEAMMHTTSHAEFVRKLSAQGFEFYTRGKNFGVNVSHDDGTEKKYRFSTLGVHESYEEFASLMHSVSQAQDAAQQDFRADASQEDEKPSPRQQGDPEEHVKQDHTRDSETGNAEAQQAAAESEPPQQPEQAQPTEKPKAETPDFLRELQERRERRNERRREKSQSSGKRRGKPRR